MYICRPQSMPRVAFRAALDRLAEAGVMRKRAQTREQFCVEQGSAAPSLARLTEIHIEAAFGRRTPELPRTEYVELVRAVSREVRASRPAWRVVAGRLDPLSWVLVK